MRTEWAAIRGINNLLWVPATWLSQPSTLDNSYTSDPSEDYKLEILGEDERICSYAAGGTRTFFMAFTAMFDQF
jgi:hypothetical protein